MLELINSNSIDDIKKIAEALFPYYQNSLKYFSELDKLKNSKDDIILLKSDISNENISIREIKICIKKELSFLK